MKEFREFNLSVTYAAYEQSYLDMDLDILIPIDEHLQDTEMIYLEAIEYCCNEDQTILYYFTEDKETGIIGYNVMRVAYEPCTIRLILLNKETEKEEVK